ncbi:MAG TPA: outer membrane protein transport protein [Kofleriaceae bacterium]|nr:outer membrane protein transport protein [Kofleriaceae bacterium]
MKFIEQLAFASVLGSSAIASANAFNINEHDAAATGRGGATAATNTSPSSVVFNPGGLAVADGTNIEIGGSLIFATGAYTPLDGGDKVETDTSPAIVPSAYVTSRINDLVAVGIGLHFPFGLAISWPDAHPQSDVIQDQSLRTYFITPSVGLNLDRSVPGLSIGAGIDVVPATVELKQALIFGDTRGMAHLGGDAIGVGGRVGVMYRPPSVKGLKLGVMYRSAVTLDFEGKGDFDIDDPFRAQLPPDGDISTSITLPQQVWGGVAYSPIDQLEFEVDAVWIDWSKFKELRIELPAGAETVSPQNYKDTVSFRLGGEYKLTPQKAAVRAGFVYDPTPMPRESLTARLPDIDRKVVTLGGSKYFGDFGAHLGLLWVMPGSRQASDELYMPVYKAKYDVQAFVASLSITGHLGH